MAESSYFPENGTAAEEKQAMISGEPEGVRTSASEEVVLYDSKKAVPCSFKCISVLWCGCCAPTYYITDSMIEMSECTCCGTQIETLLFANIYDFDLEVSCCCSCCPCFNSVGDILVLGSDPRCRENGSPNQRLKNIFESKKVYDSLMDCIREKRKNFRIEEKNEGDGVQLLKEKLRETTQEKKNEGMV